MYEAGNSLVQMRSPQWENSYVMGMVAKCASAILNWWNGLPICSHGQSANAVIQAMTTAAA